MKVLLDCCFTAKPSMCSTSYLMWEVIRELSEWRKDIYFYVLYPPHKMDEEEKKFLGQHPDRVTLLPLNQSTCDRVSESYMLRNELRYYLNPWSAKSWDADIVISSRIPVLKHFVAHSARSRNSLEGTNRMFIGLEEMPVLPFRDTVPWCDWLYPDTLMSYALSSGILINNQWTKKLLKPVLKEVLSIAWQKKVLDNVHEVVPVKLERLNLKKELYQDGQDFELAFVGRISQSYNFDKAVDLFRKHFSYPIGKNRNKIKFRVSTNSVGPGITDVGEKDFIDIQTNTREEFFKFLQGTHAAVKLTDSEDFSMSAYETLLAGVPLIMYKRPWNDFLGPYPFKADNQLHAYALISALVENYEAEYEKFREWERTYWKSYVEGPMNITTSEKLKEMIESFEKTRVEFITRSDIAPSYKEKAALLTADVVDIVKDIPGVGDFIKPTVESYFSVAVSRIPALLVLKVIMEQMGYRDTNITGVMRKIT